MSGTSSFGQWLKQRRKALDLTQEELARRVGCAVVTIYKIEADARRPSKQIAGLLAQQLGIPPADRGAFVAFARATTPADAAAIRWGTPFHPPNNLLTPPTPLIGRDKDIDAAKKQLLREDTQLLTLVGPPGIGKTRLSLAVAYELLDAFPDGVFLVLLATISDPDQVPGDIVQALGLQVVGPQSPLEHLKRYLRDRQMLLVLDNFEQVLAAAPAVAELLAACPFTKVLVTSRAPLRIRRERQFPVPALSLPDLHHFPEIDDLQRSAAVELFVERAQAVQPGFSITSENARSIATLCERLDGIPLAIELISARVKLLPPASLLERLHGQWMLYSDGLRDLEPRHRTLHAAVGWSYDLLEAHERSMFSRLSVFSEGCTLEAAEAVCQPVINGLDSVASLLDKSLLQRKASMGGEPRFAMLETIREYALQRLAESGDESEIRHLHALYYLSLAETPSADLGAKRDLWLDRMELEHDNLRAALEWCLPNDVEMGLRLAVAASNFWLQRGHLIAGRFWVEKYVGCYCRHEPVLLDSLRAIRRCAGVLAYFQADIVALRRHAQALLTMGSEHRDKACLTYGFFFLGQDTLQQEKFEQAEALFKKSLEFARQIEDEGHIASTLLMLGLVARGQKNYTQALSFNTESRAIYRRLGNRWLESFVLVNSADIQTSQGEYREARALCLESLSISQDLDDQRTLSQTLEQLAGLIDMAGQPQRAACLMGAVEALREGLSVPVEPLDRAKHEHAIARLRAKLNEATFTAAWSEGRLMTLDQAVAYALSQSQQIG